jgi:1-acyl-sn-glycerol-3-phosphate acyltransferase
MNALRSILFNICFALHTIIVSTIALPVYLTPQRYRSLVHVVWASGTMFLLKYVMGISVRVVGRENLPAGACVLASKHQSAWETIAFAHLFWPVLFVLKKELIYIPFFGWALMATKQIIIDRGAGIQAMRQLIREGKRAAALGTRIPIFPEGTRTLVGTQPPLLPGVIALARHLNLPILPVALNSGTLWPRASFWKKAGVITVRIMPPLPSNLNKDELLKTLHTQINMALD